MSGWLLLQWRPNQIATTAGIIIIIISIIIISISIISIISVVSSSHSK